MLTDIIKKNYTYWEGECNKELKLDEGVSSPTSTSSKTENTDGTQSSPEKVATPSNNETLTIEEPIVTKKEDEESNTNEIDQVA